MSESNQNPQQRQDFIPNIATDALSPAMRAALEQQKKQQQPKPKE